MLGYVSIFVNKLHNPEIPYILAAILVIFLATDIVLLRFGKSTKNIIYWEIAIVATIFLLWQYFSS